MCVRAAAGAVRQRRPEGAGLPEDHPAPDLREVPGVAGLHQEADQQHLLEVSHTFLLPSKNIKNELYQKHQIGRQVS